MTSLCLVGGDLVLPTRIFRGDLVVENGRISTIAGSAPGAGGDAVALNCDGLLVAPGFIDWQVNGAAGIDLTRMPDAVYKVAQQLACYGVTRFCPTAITCDGEMRARVVAMAKEVARDPLRGDGARIHGWHLEGPWLNEDRSGVHDAAHFDSPAIDVARELSRGQGIAVVTLAPELPGSLRVIAALRAAGVVVSIGHTTASLPEVTDAIAVGATAVTHLFNAMPGLHHRDPGVVGAALGGNELICGVIVDGHHVDPIVISAIWRALGAERFSLVTDATAALGMPDGADSPTHLPLGENDVQLVGGVVRDGDGVLAGSALSMDQAVRNLVDWSDADVPGALHAASGVAARLLGLTDVGEIRLGWVADLVVLTPDLHVVYTVVDGRVVYAA